MKEVVMRIREIVLAADPRIDECIKWQAPTFVYEGNLAKIPGKHPRLEGTGDTSRVMKLGSLDEANAARGELEAIVRAWCEWRENGGTTPKRAPMTTASVKRPAKTAKRAPAPKPAPKHARAVKRR